LGFIGVGARLIVGYTVNVVEILAGIPWAQLQIKISSVAMGLMYLAASGATIALWLKTKHNFRSTSVVD
jgi:hypothetical protein